MNISTTSPRAIAIDIGQRFKTARLNANLTQLALAEKAGISVKAIKNTEKGSTTLESAISILIALELTEQLNNFISPQKISPIQLAKLKGKERQRASNNREKTHQEGTTW